MWAQVLGGLISTLICVGVICVIGLLLFLYSSPVLLNMWSRGQHIHKWAGVAPERHLVFICPKCEGGSIAVWQLPGRAKIYSSPSVTGLAGVTAVNGHLYIQDTSDCPGATAGWVLNAIRGASTTVVGQGKLTTRPPSLFPTPVAPPNTWICRRLRYPQGPSESP